MYTHTQTHIHTHPHTYIYTTVKGTTASTRPSWRETCTGADTTLKRRVSSVVKTLVQKKNSQTSVPWYIYYTKPLWSFEIENVYRNT